MSEEIPFSKKDQRQLSQFLGQELLYDYLSRQLDPERMKAMDEFVQANREVQDEIQNLNSALNYVEHMAESDLSEHLVEQIRQPVSYLQGLLQRIKFHDWPQGLKLGLEVLLVTAVLAMGAVFLPWHKLMTMSWIPSQQVVLSEVKNEFKAKGQSEDEIAPLQAHTETDKDTKFQDDKDEAPQKISALPVYGPPKPADLAPAPTPLPVAKKSEVVVATKVVPPQPLDKIAEAQNEKEKDSDTKSGKRQGWLYRGTISVVNLDTTTEKFVAKIAELGGRKAGEVELGWKKAEGTYFHFTIPEAKYSELANYLSEYGTLKVQKERHERVMSDGIIRLIFTVSEAKKKNP